MSYPVLRDSMRALVKLVRDMISDNSSESEKFSDEQIQHALDNNAHIVRYMTLKPVEKILPGGTVIFPQFISQKRFWDSSAILVDADYNVLTPVESDPLNGIWRFDELLLPKLPVRVVGAHYDVYGAAADLLEEWAAAVKACVDFDDGSQSFKLSQKLAHLMQLIQLYRARQQNVVSRVYRSDTC